MSTIFDKASNKKFDHQVAAGKYDSSQVMQAIATKIQEANVLPGAAFERYLDDEPKLTP